MTKTPNYDVKIKTILDSLQPGEQICSLTGEKWQLPEKEIEYYKKFNVPPHNVSPNTLWKQMAYYDCAYQFWWNKHFETGAPVLSFHHPASGIRVLPDKEWHTKDFSETFEEFDLAKPFFSQLRNLELCVPLLATFNRVEPENSIVLMSMGDRDSYFVFACKSERSFFSGGAFGIADSSVVWLAFNITDSHYITHSQRLHNCRYVRESLDCVNSNFLFDCRNCNNCFGATNRRNAEYLFFNEQLTKDEYETRLSKIDLGQRSVVEAWQKKFDELLVKEGIWPENFNVSTEQSSGDYLGNAVRCTECFSSGDNPVDAWRSAWIYGNSQGCVYSWGMVDNSDVYMCVSSPNSSKSKFCYRSFRLDNCEYCLMSSDCRDCFGCVGLKNKRFCILNKQYEETEYWQKVDELKCLMLERGEYGHYLPPELSSTYVPEGGATVYCGATEDELQKIGGLVFDPNAEGATGVDRLKVEPRTLDSIPDSIDDLGDDWVGVPIYDEKAKRTFSFLKPELDYYRAKRIAPPAEHFIRRLNEVALNGQLSSFETKQCHKCQKELLVSKCPNYPDRKIYCNDCYLKYLEENN
ncbi:MAG: hypothetical protein UX09_C0015G0004 [Candidatus Uhrbacteria bacterium GW2011_GWE2_45_35]|uniref:Caib/baif family protein n=2 Tax=Candidatus Uhriibacteriota TaxID=1752732 RepID=A0A0G1JAD8_9BACT|nr:MAG: hypothetical protein UW63_C0073G0002 [Candidatus Uhrbacteria bacterium GW2011_GWF2_44_350]KKU08617.1 MAG: hypothetical protein UX09_C0015G0004 [Candidatus Uhrbacteria bacterium GW2011_GWE2_45_35]HBR80902.1 hypothetical protein [Candidatus Uhrbacteria bacterium]HCU31428.1 hypothetical protein [Candidatus Uhrbacteria bacterium]